ncbi:hypothetical protein IFM89_030975 [Coptis chinensis]|uniref:Transposase MuDR plant domain-containing protein n=1 Tax=Coptis chinensis TaxID=261450 RepID=A0A835J2X4_9MAGN|nr:hypothetical protein IFM89_030975 [Coptis chinensis]
MKIFVEQTQELVDETEGELVTTQMEVEKPYVGMEWSTLKSCRTYLRSYAIANRFVYKGLKNDGDRIRVKCRGNECTWLFYARVIKSKKSDAFTTRCNKYEGQHSGKCRGDSKFKNRLVDAIWVAEKMLDTVRTHHKIYKARMIKEDVWNKFGVKISYYTAWDKPVCTFVEELDLMLMTLMRKRKAKAMELDINDVVPRVKAIHAKQEKYIQHYTYRSAIDTQFTVFSSHGSRCLTSIFLLVFHCLTNEVFELASYCSEYLTMKAYMRTYSRSVLPIPNDKDCGQPITEVLPPPLDRPAGRLKKNRRKDADERTETM